jgi:NUDIX domain
VTTARRIDYHDDPSAPPANSLVPSVNVIVANDAGEILMIRRSDKGNWAVPGGAIDGHRILYTSNGEVRAVDGCDHAFVADFDQVKPSLAQGDTGARDGSQHIQTALDPARPARTVRAGERLPDRPISTAPELSELDGMQKVKRFRIPLARQP